MPNKEQDTAVQSRAMDDVGVQARLRPQSVAAIDLSSGRQWTYAELDRDIAKCVGVLIRDFGLTAGDRVASLARNHILLPILHLACARAGIIYAPLNWRLSTAELDMLIADCEPAILITDQRGSWDIPTHSVDALDTRIAATAPLNTAPLEPDRVSLLLYTSGTSGRPKGVLISERNLSESAINFAILGQVNPNSRVLCDTPMFHVIGLVANIRPYLMFGGAFLVSDGFEPQRTFERLADPALAITHFFCVPQMALLLRQHAAFDPRRLSHLTAIFTGGAPVNGSDVLAWLDDGIPMVNGYGMSENGTLIGMPVDAAQIRLRPLAAGVPTSRVQLRITGSSGEELPRGQAGEIHVRGSNRALGYWRRPAETADAFRDDGWFETGDVGIQDEDGFVTLVGRIKDMYISGGENVFPAEVETVAAAFDGIVECAVVGVPDERWGEVGHIAVVLTAGTTLDAAAFRSHLEQNLARYKLPRDISVFNELPRNGAGKIVKSELLLRLTEAGTGHSTQGPAG